MQFFIHLAYALHAVHYDFIFVPFTWLAQHFEFSFLGWIK